MSSWRDHHEVRQAQPLGLGHSILCARPVVGDNPFIVVLPDIIIDTASADPLRYNLAAMAARFNEQAAARCWRTHERRSPSTL
ncbi:hypothetical protein ACVXG8_25680 [Escherichia coli]